MKSCFGGHCLRPGVDPGTAIDPRPRK
jgi:hypothetical protein